MYSRDDSIYVHLLLSFLKKCPCQNYCSIRQMHARLERNSNLAQLRGVGEWRSSLHVTAACTNNYFSNVRPRAIYRAIISHTLIYSSSCLSRGLKGMRSNVGAIQNPFVPGPDHLTDPCVLHQSSGQSGSRILVPTISNRR